jgi:hypothetical protein
MSEKSVIGATRNYKQGDRMPASVLNGLLGFAQGMAGLGTVGPGGLKIDPQRHPRASWVVASNNTGEIIQPFSVLTAVADWSGSETENPQDSGLPVVEGTFPDSTATPAVLFTNGDVEVPAGVNFVGTIVGDTYPTILRGQGSASGVFGVPNDEGEVEEQTTGTLAYLGPAKNFNGAGWWIRVGGGGGGTSAPAEDHNVTIVLPAACPLAFYDTQPAPQNRKLDDTTKLPLATEINTTDFTNGFLTALSMGVAKKAGEEYKPVKAYYPSDTTEASELKPWVVEWREVADADPEPEMPEDMEGSWTLFLTYPYEQGKLYVLQATQKPKITGTPIYADFATKTVPLYRRRLKIKVAKGICQTNSLTDNVNNSWAKLEYISEQPETVKIPPPPTPPGWALKEYNSNGVATVERTFTSTNANGEPISNTRSLQISRQQGAPGTGEYTFKSCDKSTGVCTYSYTPLTVDYKEYSLPFWYGLTQPDPWSLTSDSTNAQLDYPPCLCDDLDRNEWLIPGQSVKASLKTIDLIYKKPYIDKDENNQPDTPLTDTISFDYWECTGPAKYSTTFEGTPKIKFMRFKKGENYKLEQPNQAPKDLGEDYYIEDYGELPNPTPENTLYPFRKSFFLEFTDNDERTPIISQPFGIFNECDSVYAVGMFVREDTDGIRYPMTARLDYVPFGYAIETQTPSCFYRITQDENCAPRLVGVRYDVVREGRELYVKGACYKPCSSLTKM